MPPDPQPMEIVAPRGIGRAFEGSVRAGLADTAPSGRVRLDALARWLQDVAHQDVEDAGLVDRATWVVRRLRLRVRRFPRLGERIPARTWCSGLGRMWAERRTTLGGVDAVAVWVHLDPQSLRPRPFDEEEMAIYAESAGDRRIKARLRHPLPGEAVERSPWRFRATDLDVAAHVNNAAYWAPVEERLIGGPEPERVDAEIEFRGAAQAGDAVVLSEDAWLWIASGSGEVHASVVVR